MILSLLVLSALCCATGCVNTTASLAAIPSQTTSPESGANPDQPVIFTDSFGNTVSLSHPAERIVCQNGDAAEMLINIGAGERIVGVYNTLAKTPEYVRNLPNAVV